MPSRRNPSACARARALYERSAGAAPQIAAGTRADVELGPYRSVGEHAFETASHAVTAEDDALADRLGWVRRAGGGLAAPAVAARPGELVQIRRPGRARAKVERVPETASTALVLLSTVLLIAAGCGSNAPTVSIELTAPAPGQVLTIAEDDVDPERFGLQFDVEASTSGLDHGTTLNLFIDGEQQARTGRVDQDGQVVLADVLLPPGEHEIFLETTTGSIASDEQQQYTLRALEITTPDNDARLTIDDDTNEAEPGIQIEVSAAAFALDLDEEVTVLRDRMVAGEPQRLSRAGEVSFTGLTLNNGSHTLQVRQGEGDDAIASAEISVEVQDSCAAVTFLSPALPEDGATSISLGGQGQCPADDDAFTTTVSFATDAGNLRPVQLFINGQLFDTTTVDRSTVTFERVPLARRSSANTIEVRIENSDGVICREPFPADVFVDCAGVDCMITGPSPIAVVDDDSALSLYLNAAMRGEGGYEIEVQSVSELDGREVELVIDGNTRRALRATAEASGRISSALFTADLSEGAHTIEALCTDASGNVTASGEVVWIVDTSACGVEITDPAEATVFVPADDQDRADDGTQIAITAAVAGDDCVRERAAPCVPDDGIAGADFVDHDGTSPVLSTITLDDDVNLQSLCVEVEDRAGNVGLGSVIVGYHPTPPRVRIDSPGREARYNAAGGGGYIADADPGASPTACDAAFSIACSLLGVDVELYHAGDTSPFASAPCQAPEPDDPPLADGYAGRAAVTAFFEDGDGSTVIFARQTFEGSASDQSGNSDAITLYSDCRRPGLSFDGNPCGDEVLGQLTLAQAAARDLTVADNTLDIASIALSVSNTDGTTATPAPTATTPGSAPWSAVRWDAVDLGGVGTVTITVAAEDDFENVSALECSTIVVDDLPSILSFTAPIHGAVLGPADDCGPGTAAVVDVRVRAVVDRQADRVASVLVNGDEVASHVAIAADGSIDLCVPVPDNATNGQGSTLTLHVESTLGSPPGTAERSRIVHVVLAGPSSGIVIDPLVPPALDDLTHRDRVTATWPEPTQDYAGQLRSYEMRCDGTALAAGADDAAKSGWWAAADPTGLGRLTPDDDPEVALALRPEEQRHCVLRAVDIAGNPTPIVQSTELTMRLRQVVVAVATTTVELGTRVVPAGDVDGDGFEDVLIGGLGRAELIFGTGGDPASARKVIFVGAGDGVGRSVAGLGDFNGDGLNDFAIGDPAWNSLAGRVSVFFGRPQADWPTTPMNIEALCSADLCLEGTGNGFAGSGLASAGDFDADGRPDLAIGSPFYPSVSATDGQLIIILGAAYEARSCSAQSDCRGSEDCVGTACGLNAGTFWQLRFDLLTGNWTDPPSGPAVARLNGFRLDSSGMLTGLGTAIVSLAAFDQVAGHDLVVTSPSLRQVHFLSGRMHSGTTGLDPLLASDLGLRDDMGDPDGVTIVTHASANSFGFNVSALGDFYDVTGATATGVPDIAIGTSLTDTMYVASGDPLAVADPGFNAPLITVSGTMSNIGHSLANGEHAVFGTLGDLDLDGMPDLLVGTRLSKDVMLWYADTFAASVMSSAVAKATGISILLQAQTPQTADLIVGYAGDFNGDGHADIVVGDTRANTNCGQAILLY